MDENAVLTKLIDSFDDFKERLIRIEENVKSINSIKDEVDILKVRSAADQESIKSAHKRIDNLEQSIKDKEKDIKFIKQQIIVGAIMFVFTVLAGVVLFLVTRK